MNTRSNDSRNKSCGRRATTIAMATLAVAAWGHTATAIARGELSAQRAFMNGRLAIEGDTLALAHAQPALRGISDAFAEVRSSTEW